jgi:rhodanese-related sulfurtransferase
MALNPAFVAEVAAEVRQAGADENTPLLFLCRSGARSRAAALAMTRAGFGKSYNVAGGFEGDPDETQHRGRRNGWKAEGLPWRQS